MFDGLQLATALEHRAISYSFVVVAGLLDGLNPCAIGLIVLLGGCVFLCIKDVQRIARVGMIYILTIFTTYFLIGVFFSHVIYQFMQWEGYVAVQYSVRWLLAGILWIAAIYNVIHFYLDRAHPEHVREEAHLLHRLKKYATQWPVAVAIGVIVTIFALPCSLPLYVGSIAALSHTFTPFELLKYLFVYNLMFIMPLIFTLAIITRGHGYIEHTLHEKNRWLHLLMAVACIVLGIIFLIL